MSQDAIRIRKYSGEAEFQRDAGQYVRRGFRIASQGWEQGGPSRAGKLFYVLSAIMAALGVVGLIAGEEQAVVLVVFAIIMLVIAARERVRVLSVTYEVTGPHEAPGRPT